MGKFKLKFFTIALIAMVLTLFTQNTIAYYSTKDKATNVVTSGQIKMIVHETTAQGTKYPERCVEIVPGEVVSKEVFVENIGKHPFYLRVKVVSEVDSAELSGEDCFKLNVDTTNWKYVDGWYYYQGIVQPGKVTPKVFTEVEIDGDKVDNNYLGKILSLSVIAHAVQSENNPITGDEFHTASGWPQE